MYFPDQIFPMSKTDVAILPNQMPFLLLGQGSATFNSKKAIWACFLLI